MSRIVLSAFSGEQPRVIPRLMPPSAAQSAINARLDDGALTPMRKPAQAANASSSDALTIYRHNGTWLDWDAVINAAPGPVADDRLYYTGDGAPKMRVDADNIYDLAVPRPATAITAAVTGSGSGDVVTRVYVFTYVTDYGEESEPGDATEGVDWQPGQTLTLSGFETVPTGRAITKQRIYRSQTGQSGTYFYLIAERNASTSDYVDDVAVDAFQEALPSASWNAPPDDLAGLISMPNGMMAGFVGKKLYFCEPYHPHAWPETYVLTTSYDIVGLAAIGSQLIVLTEGEPYLASGASPDAMQMQKIEQNFPCINARGIQNLGYVVAYPSQEGLVAVGSDGSFRLATENIFSRSDWQALSPTTMIAGQLNRRYATFYDTIDNAGRRRAGLLFIDLSGESFLIRADAIGKAVYYDIGDAALYYRADGVKTIYQFDAANTPKLKLYWKSKQFVLPAADNFGAILIDAIGTSNETDDDAQDTDEADIIAANAALIAAGPLGGEINGAVINAYPLGGDTLAELPMPAGHAFAVGVYADGVLVASISKTNRPVRLPSEVRARTWEIDAYGDAQVQAIVMARTIDELRSTPV